MKTKLKNIIEKTNVKKGLKKFSLGTQILSMALWIASNTTIDERAINAYVLKNYAPTAIVCNNYQAKVYKSIPRKILSTYDLEKPMCEEDL